MKHKVSQLEGALLDAAVAKVQGYELDEYGDNRTIRENGGAPSRWTPSSDWLQGGPLLQEKCSSLRRVYAGDLYNNWGDQPPWPETWEAHVGFHKLEGPTPLIAAMRAVVASKFGNEVDL
jgi:hypothetical protein